jgi:tRNA A37 threonylcarbamoyladenosine biosynthesis protein TsaE
MSTSNLSLFFQKYNLTNSQSELVSKLEAFIDAPNSSQNIFLLKGYAGTGKTFITKGLTEYLKEIRRTFILAAPTGKAAKVIANKTQNEAYTIHKTIYSTNDVKEYKENESDKTYKFYFDLRVNEDPNNTIYIIDEASMISNVYGEPEFFRFGSGFLLQDLLKYINIDCNDHNKKIIFIGDNAQLPPIGMNFSPALDNQYLTKTFNLLVNEYELTEVVRQKNDSGILKNTVPIRKSLVAQTFNQLDIETNYNDVSHVEHEDFLNTYLKESEYKIDPDTIVIAFSNASVKEYNDKIRENYFPGNANNIVVNDKILVTSNNANYEIFISNGDFGIVQEVSYKPEVKQIVTKNGIINETLYFRDVTILFYSLNGIPYSIKCKIIENLLYSDKPNLSSNEHKALYVDFMMRHPHLKANTKEWKDALKKDPYFNALKIKFGYAITCHKAQGSEWKNVFLNCKTHQSVLSQSYFRWIYTAITRTSEKLFTLDEPHFTPFTKMQQHNIPVQQPIETKIVDESINHESSVQTALSGSIEDAIYLETKILLDQSDIKITDTTHNQYCEQYTLEYNNETCRIKINYNGKNKITKISAIETNTLAKLAEFSLKPLENKTLFLTNITDNKNQFIFAENFLEEYYNAILNVISNHDIEIIQIEHFNYLERYTFKQNNEVSIIDFYYNGKKQFTRSQPQNNSSIELSKLILSLLN